MMIFFVLKEVCLGAVKNCKEKQKPKNVLHLQYFDNNNNHTLNNTKKYIYYNFSVVWRNIQKRWLQILK